MDDLVLWVGGVAIALSYCTLVALLGLAQFQVYQLGVRVKSMEREMENLSFELRRQEAENVELMRKVTGMK